MGRIRPTILLLSAAAVLCACGLAVLVWWLLPGDDDGGGPPPARAGHSSGAPTGHGPAPVSVPTVRHWRGTAGPSWRMGDGTRVVTHDGPLTDEARLLADELHVPAAKDDGDAADVTLRLEEDADIPREGYVLTSHDGKVRITGSTQAGVFYGTRTLLQTVHAQGRIGSGTVHDAPDHPQRGLSLDIARKNLTADWIEDRIREMGDLKLNQLQLHLSDDQAFRLESDTHPEIVSPQHLTKKQMRHIVRLAASRHIAVIPEIDSPGHLGAILRAHPGFQLHNAQGEAVTGAADVTDKRAGALIDDLFTEYRDLFPAKYWHVGGDEYPALLASDPAASYPQLIQAAHRRYGPEGDIEDLATAWTNARAKTVRSLGKTPQVWNDGIYAGTQVAAGKNRQVTYWTGKENGARPPEDYLEAGRKVVNVNDEYLYYVLGEPNQFTYPTGERIYEDWTPAVLRGTEAVPDSLAGPDHVLGGRFALWCDIADAQTPAQIAAGIHDPLAATAQKLWDPERPDLTWPQFRDLIARVDS
jgi:N-acetyl-beta-hexosaminidase